MSQLPDPVRAILAHRIDGLLPVQIHANSRKMIVDGLIAQVENDLLSAGIELDWRTCAPPFDPQRPDGVTPEEYAAAEARMVD
jgi:hypothetical protein